jgi:hypothetical protein
MLYPGVMALQSTRPSGSGDLERIDKEYGIPGFAVDAMLRGRSRHWNAASDAWCLRAFGSAPGSLSTAYVCIVGR